MALKHGRKDRKKSHTKSGTNPHQQNNKNYRIKKSKSAENNSGHPNQLLTVDDRKDRLKEALNCLSQEQLDMVYSDWSEIIKGINYAIQRDELRELEGIADRIESYEYELLRKRINDILEDNIPKRTIFNWAKGHARKRKPSWYNSLFRQRESIQIQYEPCEIEYDEIGNIADLGFDNSEWMPIVDPPNPFTCTPEDLIINFELSEIIKQLPSIVGSSNRKRKSEYQRILELQLSGVDVRPKHGKQLGIEKDDVANLKFQAIKFAAQILAEIFPELEETQAVFRTQKGKSWNSIKSNFNERKNLYRQLYSKEMEPRTIRVLKVIDGSKEQEPDYPEPPASALNVEIRKKGRMA
jgi:hypothetical protein